MKLIECIIPFILAIAIICCASAGENMGVAVMASSLALYAARACMRNGERKTDEQMGRLR